MSEHLTRTQIEAYARRKLSAADLLPVSDHMGSCEACRRQIERTMDSDAAFFELRSGVFGEAAEILSSPEGPTPLTFEQTAEYIDGSLTDDELQVVKDHLTVCEQCLMAGRGCAAFSTRPMPRPRNLGPLVLHFPQEQ